MITLSCPKCASPLKVPDTWEISMVLHCENCGQNHVIPDRPAKSIIEHKPASNLGGINFLGGDVTVYGDIVNGNKIVMNTWAIPDSDSSISISLVKQLGAHFGFSKIKIDGNEIRVSVKS